MRSVSFSGHGGVTLRGWWWAPAPDRPTVVMAHGFSATKEMAIDRFAKAFAADGCGVLLYDHRCLGASDGEPRQVINPWAQARDYRCAIDWVERRRGVDRNKLVAWGSSFSGGEVLVVGALDVRVAAVIANVPFAGLPNSDYDSDGFPAMVDAFAERADDTNLFGPLKVVNDPVDAEELRVFLPQPESTDWFLSAGRRPRSRWQNRVWLAGVVGSNPPFDPGMAVRHLHKPLLMVVATDDNLAATDVALATFARAHEPKELVMVDGHHFTPYEDPAFAEVSKSMLGFLRTL